jgi:hypothetical protein
VDFLGPLTGVFTCHELLQRVLQLCHRLQPWTIDDQLGICFQRPSLSAVVALLAALRMERGLENHVFF